MTTDNETIQSQPQVSVTLNPGDRLLRALPKLRHIETNPPDCKRLVITDTETTGLDPEKDKAVELALYTIYLDRALDVIGAGACYHGFEDPGQPLSETVKKVTGLTDAHLAGKSFDTRRVNDVLDGANYIVAHNAAFDRGFIDRRFPSVANSNIPWLCSIEDLDWKAMGCPSNALQVIAWWLGHNFVPHRAMSDCQALGSILALKSTPELSFAGLLLKSAGAGRATYRVMANNSPFELKDVLKTRGYHWNGPRKVWWIDVRGSEAAEAEALWCAEHARARPHVERIPAEKRFSKEWTT